MEDISNNESVDALCKLANASEYGDFVEEYFRKAIGWIPWDELRNYDPKVSSKSHMIERSKYMATMEQKLYEFAECKDKRALSMKASAVFVLLHASEPCGDLEYHRDVLGWAGPKLYIRHHFVEEFLLVSNDVDMFLESKEFGAIRQAFSLRSFEDTTPSDYSEVCPIKRNADRFLSRLVKLMGGTEYRSGGLRTWRRITEQHGSRK